METEFMAQRLRSGSMVEGSGPALTLSIEEYDSWHDNAAGARIPWSYSGYFPSGPEEIAA